MAQFDVHRVRGGGLVVDCQSRLLSQLPTRFVAPLRLHDDSAARRLNPVFAIDGRDYMLIAQLAGAIDARSLGEVVASLAAHEYAIKDALDMVVAGF